MGRILAASLAAAFLAAACAGSGSDGATTQLTAADSGSAIQVADGERIVISLEANPTTGYSWQQVPGLDGSVVTLISEAYEQDEAEPNMVGVGGTDVWTYEAVGPGTTTIALTYVQASDPTAAESFTVNVTVAP